ncbi:hypothetical protein C8J56DRAFT_1025439 [Mycena floridula]|nr:hypothetical protein C8J56DRAFT_1025439 [Mycena floridula]
MATTVDQATFLKLYKGNVIPLRACLAGLTWMLHDYLLTIEDEIRYIWPQKRNFGKFMFFWIRYYTMFILIFDVAQIHSFARPGATNPGLCVAMDSIIRVIGAISLWSVEIIMQLRIYALYSGSKRVAIFNGVLFIISIGGFFGVLARNAMVRRQVIANFVKLPLPGCPSIHSGLEWAQWVPAAAFEVVLCGFALVKSVGRIRTEDKSFGMSLYSILIRDNLLYFLGVTCVLLFNNFMVLGFTHIPWFSYAPFHAAVGIVTARMLINLRKVASFNDGSFKVDSLTVLELDFMAANRSTISTQDMSVMFVRMLAPGYEYEQGYTFCV